MRIEAPGRGKRGIPAPGKVFDSLPASLHRFERINIGRLSSEGYKLNSEFPNFLDLHTWHGIMKMPAGLKIYIEGDAIGKAAGAVLLHGVLNGHHVRPERPPCSAFNTITEFRRVSGLTKMHAQRELLEARQYQLTLDAIGSLLEFGETKLFANLTMETDFNIMQDLATIEQWAVRRIEGKQMSFDEERKHRLGYRGVDGLSHPLGTSKTAEHDKTRDFLSDRHDDILTELQRRMDGEEQE